MEVVIEALWWLGRNYSMFAFMEFAASDFYRVGEPVGRTLIILNITSASYLLLSYGIVMGIWKFLIRLVFKKKVKVDLTQLITGILEWFIPKVEKVVRRKINLNLNLDNTNRRAERWGNIIAQKLSGKKYLWLFVFNLPPVAFFSTATIVAVDIGKIRLGILPILAGNTVKVLGEVLIIYYLIGPLVSFIPQLF